MPWRVYELLLRLVVLSPARVNVFYLLAYAYCFHLYPSALGVLFSSSFSCSLHSALGSERSSTQYAKVSLLFPYSTALRPCSRCSGSGDSVPFLRQCSHRRVSLISIGSSILLASISAER